MDAIYGLQRVKSGGGGVAQPVCSSVGGAPLSFPSSISTGGPNGEIYFTDYSKNYNIKYVHIIRNTSQRADKIDLLIDNVVNNLENTDKCIICLQKCFFLAW